MAPLDTTRPLAYQSGFGNEYATEAVAGAWPRGRNSPQKPALQLYLELMSGSAFTAPRRSARSASTHRSSPC